MKTYRGSRGRNVRDGMSDVWLTLLVQILVVEVKLAFLDNLVHDSISRIQSLFSHFY